MFIHQTITKSLFSLSQSVSWSYPSRRHTIHRLTEAKADFPALVSSHHSSALFLVLLQGHGGWWRLVHDHELSGARRHVFLLRSTGRWLQNLSQVRHVHHPDADHPDGDGLRGQLPGVFMDAARPRVPVPCAEHFVVVPHVPQLLCALLPVLLRSLHHKDQIQCSQEKPINQENV